MDKKPALKLFTELEAETVEYENHQADTNEWIDGDTPPTATHPRYAVRLDASLNQTDERVYRLRVTLHPWLTANESALAIEWAATQARHAGARSVEIQNSGIELS